MRIAVLTLGSMLIATAASGQSYFSTSVFTEGKAISPTGIASYSEQGGPFLSDDRCGLADTFGTFVLMDDPELLVGFDDRANCNGVSDAQEIVGHIKFTGPPEQLPVIYSPSTGEPIELPLSNPSLPSGDRNRAEARDISADGLVVVGEDNTSSIFTQAVKWVGPSRTPTPLHANFLGPSADPADLRVSPSGGFIAGEMSFSSVPPTAFRETHPAGFVQQLTGSSSDVFSVNDDGTIFGDSGSDAVTWIGTSTTPTILPSHPDCQPFQRAIAGSLDLSIIIGSCASVASGKLQGVVWLNQTLPVLMVDWLDSRSVPLPFGLLTEFIPADMDASGTFLVGTDMVFDAATVITVPEPATGVFLAFGVLGIIGLGGMRRNQTFSLYNAAFLAVLSPVVFASAVSASDTDQAAAEHCVEAPPEHQIACMLEALGLDKSEIEAPHQGPSAESLAAAAEREERRQEALRNRARVIEPE